jgi:hypothetical protein
MDETRQEAIGRISELLDKSITLTGKDVGGNGRFTFNTYDPAAEERAAIVAYLQTNPDPVVRNWISAQIEAGEHLKEHNQ